MNEGVEDLMNQIGLLRGGSLALCKPVVQITFYKSEGGSAGTVTVDVGRCGGMDERVYSGPPCRDGIRVALVAALAALRESGAK